MPPSSPTPAPVRRLGRSARAAVTVALSATLLAAVTPVSYTHLTLPTIYSV